MIRVFLLLVLSITSLSAQAAFRGSDDVAKVANRDASLNRYIGNYPRLLNPMLWSLSVEAQILGTSGFAPVIFDRLVLVDPDDGSLKCWICTKYEIAKDRKSATYYIVKDAKFHDGKPLTAEDIKFSFDVIMHPKVDNLNLKSGYLQAVESVEVVDKHTLKVNFKNSKFMNIYEADVPIIPKHLFGYFDKNPEKFMKDNKFNRNPVGSGPYKFRKWKAGKSVELVRNDKWWGFKDERFANLYNFKKLRFKIITDDNVALQAFKKGEYDYAALQSYNYKKIKEGDQKKLKVEAIHLEPKISTSFMFIGLNARLPKFADAKTRHALALLTDRFSTLDKFSKGLRPPTNGPWGVNSPASCPLSKCPIIKYDPAKARKLLKEAGWADSDGNGVLDRTVDGKKQELSFNILADSGDYSKNVLGVYSTAMRKAGVDMKLKLIDWTAMIKLIDELSFEAYFSGFGMGHPINPRQLWHSENTKATGSNTVYFVSEEADKLMDKFEFEFDAEKRSKINQKIHSLIYNSHNMIFHHEGGGCYLGRNKKLMGVELANYKSTCVFWPRWYKQKTMVN